MDIMHIYILARLLAERVSRQHFTLRLPVRRGHSINVSQNIYKCHRRVCQQMFFYGVNFSDSLQKDFFGFLPHLEMRDMYMNIDQRNTHILFSRFQIQKIGYIHQKVLFNYIKSMSKDQQSSYNYCYVFYIANGAENILKHPINSKHLYYYKTISLLDNKGFVHILSISEKIYSIAVKFSSNFIY